MSSAERRHGIGLRLTCGLTPAGLNDLRWLDPVCAKEMARDAPEIIWEPLWSTGTCFSSDFNRLC